MACLDVRSAILPWQHGAAGAEDAAGETVRMGRVPQSF
jgi:hypothetical protein